MKVEFLVDYRGVLTGEKFFRAGETVELDEATAKQLNKAGRVSIIESPKSDGPPPPTFENFGETSQERMKKRRKKRGK